MSLVFASGTSIWILSNYGILKIFVGFAGVTIFGQALPKFGDDETRIIDKPLLFIGVCVYAMTGEEAFDITDITRQFASRTNFVNDIRSALLLSERHRCCCHGCWLLDWLLNWRLYWGLYRWLCAGLRYGDEPPGSVRSEFADLAIHHPIPSKRRHYNPHTLNNTANTR